MTTNLATHDRMWSWIPGSCALALARLGGVPE